MADEGNTGSVCESLIKEGDQVVLKTDKALKVVQVRRNRKIFFEKLHFNIDNAINCPFGSGFKVRDSKLNLIKPGEDVDELRAAESGEESSYQPIQSDGQSQKLTRDDVDSLKSQGTTGNEIVNQLVENSATFKKRTEFSKAKYRNKKHKKHNAKITVLKPTTKLIAEMYYSRTSNKICELRPDALSQLLSLVNVRANSNIIVMEQCQGLVVGAVLERMGGYGSIVQIHSGDFPTRLAMECFNFPPSFMQTVNGFPLCKVNSLKEQGQQKEDTSHSQKVVTIKEEKEIETEEKEETKPQTSEKSSDEQSVGNSKEQEKLKRRNIRQLEESKARTTLQLRKMDGLVVVCKFHPSAIVAELLEFVASSRPFVIFSQFKEPLVECYSDLRNRGGVVNLQLTETWWRHYQVLKGRTHPLVNMDGSGGYLLSGTTVERFPESDSPTTTVTLSEEPTDISKTATVESETLFCEEKPGSSEQLEDDTCEPPAKRVKETATVKSESQCCEEKPESSEQLEDDTCGPPAKRVTETRTVKSETQCYKEKPESSEQLEDDTCEPLAKKVKETTTVKSETQCYEEKPESSEQLEDDTCEPPAKKVKEEP